MKLPSLLKHMTMAIYDSPSLHASGGAPRFEAAFEAARNRLVEYGYLSKGSESGPAEKIKLTSKGNLRENKHKFGEGGANAKKNAAFDMLYEKTFAEPKKPDNDNDDLKKPVRRDANGKPMPHEKSVLKPKAAPLKSGTKPLQKPAHKLKPSSAPLKQESAPLKDNQHPKKISIKDQF